MALEFYGPFGAGNMILRLKKDKKVKVFHSVIAVGAVGVRVPLCLGHSE